ncbi:phosphoglycolate phosphatase [Sulfitobacter sp. HNIBRBA3233]|uniref:phosphoglycolate phosphatase n=1 Tax=Sulfitobacter marinivivus TaxID=3158558 RepID=UPI0032DFE4B2
MARIVFDLDGTLIDSAPDIHALMNEVLAALGGGEITLAQTREFIGNGVDVFVRRTRTALGLPDAFHAAMVAQFRAGYDDAVSLTTIYPGVVEGLEVLHGAGHRLAICTNKPEAPCRAVLAHLDLARFFDVVIGGDTLAQSKPDPAPLRAALEALGEGPAIFVGDSEVDAATAKAAETPFALFTEGYRKSPVEEIRSDASFDDFARLPDIVNACAVQVIS